MRGTLTSELSLKRVRLYHRTRLALQKSGSAHSPTRDVESARAPPARPPRWRPAFGVRTSLALLSSSVPRSRVRANMFYLLFSCSIFHLFSPVCFSYCLLAHSATKELLSFCSLRARIRVWAGLGSLPRLQGRVLPASPAPASWRCPPVCGRVTPVCLPLWPCDLCLSVSSLLSKDTCHWT